MVGVAQLVECKIVILVVVGSIPIVHPISGRLAAGARISGRPGIASVSRWPRDQGMQTSAKVAELVDAPDLGSGILTM